MSGKSTPVSGAIKKRRKSKTFNPSEIKNLRIRGLLDTDDESSSISPRVNLVDDPALQKALKEKSKIYYEKKKLRTSVAKVKKVLPRDGSSNHVYVIDDTFLKISGSGEKLMYDFTTFIQQNRKSHYEEEIIKYVPKFAPTGLIDLKTLNGSNESKFKTTRESVGSFQPMIKGLSLKELLSVPDYEFFLNMDPEYEIKLAFALLYTVVLGQYDLHSNNIIVDVKIKNNKQQYNINDLEVRNGMVIDNENNVLQKCTVKVTFIMFDLMRSLANSQDVIIWGSILTVACRCALFRLAGSFNKMSKHTIMLLETEIINLMSSGEKLENDFLKRDEIKKLVKGLPNGYFYEEYVIAGYKNRCNTMLRSIRQEKIICPCDIVYRVHPNYKFFAMIAIIVRYMSQQEIIDSLSTNDKLGLEEIDQMWYHGLALAAAPCVGNKNIPLEDRLKICYNLGISPRQLMALCKRDDFSYVDTIRKIKSEIWFNASMNKIIEDLDTIYDIHQNNKTHNEDIDTLTKIQEIFENVCGLLDKVHDKIEKIDKESVTYKHVWVHVIPHIGILVKSVAHFKECIDIINDVIKSPENKRMRKLLNYSLEDYDFYNDINKVITIYNEKKIGQNNDLHRILVDFYKKSIPDFKDIPSDSILEVASNYIDNTFNLFGLSVFEDVQSEAAPAIEKHNSVLEIEGKVLPGYYMRVKKDKYVELDYCTKPGFIIYKKREMPVPFFIEWFNSHRR